MAELTNGSLTGKLGTIVGFVRDGKNLVRVNSRRTAPPTEKELLNRYIFGLVQSWVSPVNAFVKLGFRNYCEKFSGANAAKSLIFRDALFRNGYDSHIDPTLVQLSAGKVILPENLRAALTPEGTVEFRWDPAGGPHASPRDRIIMLAYNVESRFAKYELSGPKRHMAQALLSLENALPGTYHLYAAFVAAEGEAQSDSRYLGTIEW